MLWIINFLNRPATGDGEGEGGLVEPAAAEAAVSREIASLASSPEPAEHSRPSSPPALPAGVRLIAPGGPADHGELKAAQLPAVRALDNSAADAGDGVTDLWDWDDDLEGLLHEISGDVAREWTGRS